MILFLLDYVPRKVVLDEPHRAQLPARLADWVRFTLTWRGVEPRWIEPVMAAVHENAEEFFETYDDEAGPARQLLARLTDEGVDLADREQVDAAVGRWNAEQLARSALAASGPPPAGAAYQLRIALRHPPAPGVAAHRRTRECDAGDAARVRAMGDGWDDVHLHQWDIAGDSYGVDDGERDVLPESKVALAEVAPKARRCGTPTTSATAGNTTSPSSGCCDPTRRGRYPVASDWARELADMYDGFDPGRFEAQQATRRLRAALPT